MGKCQSGKKQISRHLALFFIFFFAAAFLFLKSNARELWGFPTIKTVASIAKSEVVQDDDDVSVGAGRKANVLFLLDVGSTMTFTPTGTLPDYDDLRKTLSVSAAQEKAAGMLKDCTYGAGGLPLVGGEHASTSNYSSRYGREISPDNNAVAADFNLSKDDFKAKHIDNYYFPFDTTGHPLTSLGAASTNTPQPYALVLKESDHWNNPGAAVSGFTENSLVPNDSRMYKLKLVMWRLLDDPSLFEHLRFGMATTFQEQSGHLWADFYKYPNYGKTGVFINGAGPNWATGLGDGTSAGSGYYQSASAYTGVLRQLYTYAKTDERWAHINRAVLRVPIADYSDEQRDLFRMWIDGYEDVNTSTGSHYYFKNPELFADGKTYLSTALYPGHPSLDRNRLLTKTYGSGRYGIIYSTNSGSSSYITASALSTSTFNRFNRGSGEALGTVLDFFSPHPNAANATTAPASSFPIKDNCESNWVVVFTAGDDSTADEYSAAEAALKLFKETKNNTVTTLSGVSGNTNTLEQMRLDDGIRTIVVGFVDDTDSSTVGLRAQLTAMAAAGDPRWNGSDWVPDYDKKPYFANDVPGLIDALRAIMVRINSGIRPAKGPMTESSSLELETDTGAFDLFAASYKVNNNDQWQGQLTRYVSVIDAAGKITVKTPPKWELGAALLAYRGATSTGGRNLVYWTGNNNGFERLTYSTGSTPYSTAISELLGLSNADLTTPSIYSGKLHPSRAMINWLLGYDYNYTDTKVADREFMLSDFGQSGVAMVIPPTEATLNLPGYSEWVASDTAKKRATRVFAQSNEGILHVINPIGSGSGIEQMAILPPPVMQPYRLTATKFTVTESGTEKKVDWIDDTYSSTTGAGYASRPAYVLDGPIYLRDFNLNMSSSSQGWGTYLIGMLGRAGNGLYFMDVTAPNNPKFLWFRETAYRKDGSVTLIQMEGKDSAPEYTQGTVTMTANSALYTKPDDYPFYQMGYNMPRPVAGVAQEPGSGSMKNFIALAGGIQEKLDLSQNGTVGAALYLLNPEYKKNNQDVRVFNGGSFSSSSARVGTVAVGSDPYMGMLLTPPALWRSETNRSIAAKVFAADNRGNHFMVNLERGFGTSATQLIERNWNIQAVASLRKNSSATGENNNHCNPFGLVVTKTSDGNSVWVGGGTANTSTRIADSANAGVISNNGQYIYAFKVNESKALYRDDLVELKADEDNVTIEAGDNGWYVTLSAPSANYNEEYVTTKPVLMGGKMYIATFIPKRDSATCDNAVDGSSRIYAITIDTGAPSWGHGVASRYIEIKGIKIAGLTHSVKGAREKIIVSYAVTNKADADASLAYWENEGIVNQASGADLFTIGEGGGSEAPFDPLSTYINYWRTDF